ncbi:MAG: D-glycerate dehydrogenase, partial [Acidimicrobiia bacterium]|nr:D-glycerate dehydrogenase [Acidimicrobiia bacterium]
MENERIVVTRQPPGQALAILESAGSVWMWTEDRPIERQVLFDQITTATGLYTMLTDHVDEALLKCAPDLRVVSQMAVGVDNIDLAACRNRGIKVGHTPDV